MIPNISGGYIQGMANFSCTRAIMFANIPNDSLPHSFMCHDICHDIIIN